jgi:hypothetical protein
MRGRLGYEENISKWRYDLSVFNEFSSSRDSYIHTFTSAESNCPTTSRLTRITIWNKAESKDKYLENGDMLRRQVS